jgi:hypothetical protein
MQSDGSFVCDRCGRGVGNGAVTECLVVSDIDQDNRGHVLNLHFCRDGVEGEGKNEKPIKGCAQKVLSPSNVKHFATVREAAND